MGAGGGTGGALPAGESSMGLVAGWVGDGRLAEYCSASDQEAEDEGTGSGPRLDRELSCGTASGAAAGRRSPVAPIENINEGSAEAGRRHLLSELAGFLRSGHTASLQRLPPNLRSQQAAHCWFPRPIFGQRGPSHPTYQAACSLTAQPSA